MSIQATATAVNRLRRQLKAVQGSIEVLLSLLPGMCEHCGRVVRDGERFCSKECRGKHSIDILSDKR